MDIIPAIDLKKGKVVKASQGDRSLYKSIDISTRHSSNPITFIKALIITYRPSTIYLADLDSLDGDGNNIDIICRIANMFRNKIFWVDVGAQKIKKLNKRNITPILCSESCDDIRLINYVYKGYVHSYDYNNRFLGTQYFKRLNSSYKKKIIFMNISDVGNEKGPDFKYIRRMIRFSDTEYYVGGGIKSIVDLHKLNKMNITGVIVSSLLMSKKTNGYIIKKRASR
tara:strand:- start:37 stop:714 length:678 start_codon:yes stop_codon:yes gene_type:complete